MAEKQSSISQVSFELEHVLQGLFNTSLEGLLVVNPAGEMVMANQRACQLFGYAETDLLTKPVEMLIPGAHRPTHAKQVEAYHHDPIPKGHARCFPALHKDGHEFLVEVKLNPVKTSTGHFVICHLIDISNQQRAEKALRESEMQLSAIINAAVDGIITIDQRGTIEMVNPAVYTLFGYELEEMIGNNINMLMPSPDREQHDGYLDNYQQTRQAQIIGIGREVMGRKKDGTVFPFYLSVSEVSFQDRTIYTGIIHDLSQQKAAEDALIEYSNELQKRVEARTQALNEAIRGLEKEINERKQMEQRLRDTQEEMELALTKEKQLNELKSRFVSMASHEFRTPLATILSSINLIARYEETQQPEKRVKHINRIRNNVHNLTGILNDFLSLSKLEEGTIKARPEAFNLFELIQELKEEIQTMSKQGQQLIYEHEGKSQEIFLDPALLRNVLVNLLNNAVKYSPRDSTIHIQTSLQPDRLQIEIKDEGIGIPEEEQVHLFERFFRAHNATNIQGTGLGLSIVKRYVELMDGSIGFESGLQKGTTFSLQFPQPQPQSQ